jgi:L-ascorbate metabolism protein UlaG (beta-lactamase superfamily)
MRPEADSTMRDRTRRSAERTGVANRLRWLGHSTVLIELDGVRLLTDPLLRKRVLHLRRAAPLDLDDLSDVDAVLISHAHYDHLDLRSLASLGREKTVCVPIGLRGLLRRRGFASVVELAAGEKVDFGPLKVHAVRAEHPSSRALGGKSEALGYVVDGERRVYFAGDTGLFPGMAELAPEADVALLPIWGWGPSLGRAHLDPQRAAQALALIRPKIAVPIHWGTYYASRFVRSRPDSLIAPARAFVRAAAVHAPGVKVRILPPGGSLPLDEI